MAKKFIYLKKQITGIKDIEETVKAMEKISAANIHNLKISSQRMEDYEKKLKKVFCHLAEKNVISPLFQNPKGAVKSLKVILTAEKGFCGALLNRLLDFVQPRLEKNDEILIVGARGKKLCQERGIKIDYFFSSPKDIPKEEDIRELKKIIIPQFLLKKYKEVLIFYSAFESLAIHQPKIFIFLPFDKERFKLELGEILEPVWGYPIYEPSRKKILDYLIEEYLGLVFYQKVLEAKLSELSARTVAMEEAGELAKKMVSRLSLQYFREKREVITKDINDLYSHRV